MKLEFNPSRFMADKYRVLLQVLKELLGTDWRLLLDGAAVNAVDITVDFHVCLSDVAIECRDKQSCAAWGKTFDSHARLQTLYFGAPNTEHQLSVYAKNDEVLAAYACSTKGVTVTDVAAKAAKSRPRLRVEARCNYSDQPTPLHRVNDVCDPFEGTHIYEYRKANEVVKGTAGKLALELAKVSGLQMALKHLSKTERETLRRQLASATAEWWDPAAHSQQVLAAYQATGLFSASAFDPRLGRGRHVEVAYTQAAAAAKAKRKAALDRKKIDNSKFPDLDGVEE